MKKINPPSFIVLFLAALAAFWIADIINPGFNPVGVMILMLVPVFVIELLYPHSDADQVMEIEQYIAEQQLFEQQQREKLLAAEDHPEENNLAEDVEAKVAAS